MPANNHPYLKSNCIPPHLYPSFAQCKVHSLKSNLRFHTQEFLTVLSTAKDLHKAGFGNEQRLTLQNHWDFNCDNTTVTSFDKLNWIIITNERFVSGSSSAVGKAELRQSIEVCLH